MYEEDADVIFHAAGGSGSGLFEAAAEAEAWAIGVDSDQFLSSPGFEEVILTSMLKRVDTAVFDTIHDQAAGEFSGGFQTFNLENEGIDYATSGGHIDDITDQLDDLRDQIIAGDIEVPDAL